MGRSRTVPFGFWCFSFFSAFLLVHMLLGAAEARLTPKGRQTDAVLPIPPGLIRQVKFWREVFTRYSSSEVVFHDEKDVSLVYGVLPLQGPWKAWRGQRIAIRKYERRIEHLLFAIRKKLKIAPRDRKLAERIRKMFRGRSDLAMRMAAYQVRAQPGLREHFRESIIRSGRYLLRFREIFRRHGVPADLTLLPHVESSFLSRVRSSAGAVGMWQITRRTGRLFLRVDYQLDERRDPFLAAAAAARLLRRNYEDLKSWPLAITAYNHGAEGVRRAVRRTGTRDIVQIIKRYKGRSFGFASRNFYGEFLAAVEVHKNAEKYFGRLRPDPPKRFEVFPLPVYVRFPELSRRIGISPEVLLRMNPALRPSVARGRRKIPRGYPLRVPDGKGKMVREAFFRTFGKERVAKSRRGARWVMVRPGDTLSHIALRYRVPVSAVMAANDMENTLVVVGDRLLIPDKKFLPKRAAARRRSESARRRPKRRSSVVTLTKSGAVRRAARGRKKGAGIRSARVSSGGSLPSSAPKKAPAVRVPERGEVSRAEALRLALRVTPARNGKFGFVRVQENETIGHYAEWLRLSPRRLRRMNGLRRARDMRVGRRLKISFRRVSKSKFLERRMGFHQHIEKKYYRKYSVVRTIRHKVGARENVWTLVTQTYKIPLWLFRKYNPGKKLRRMVIGDELIIPVVAKAPRPGPDFR